MDTSSRSSSIYSSTKKTFKHPQERHALPPWASNSKIQAASFTTPEGSSFITLSSLSRNFISKQTRKTKCLPDSPYNLRCSFQSILSSLISGLLLSLAKASKPHSQFSSFSLSLCIIFLSSSFAFFPCSIFSSLILSISLFLLPLRIGKTIELGVLRPAFSSHFCPCNSLHSLLASDSLDSDSFHEGDR